MPSSKRIYYYYHFIEIILLLTSFKFKSTIEEQAQTIERLTQVRINFFPFYFELLIIILYLIGILGTN